MKRERIVSVRVEAGLPAPKGDTDWEAVDAMTDEEVTRRALADPEAQPTTAEQLERGWWGRFIRLARQRQGLTQEAFADAYAIPLGTLRDWEQGRKLPDASARALLRVIDREPEAARRALMVSRIYA